MPPLALTLLATGCAPSAPDWVVQEPDDLSYATGDLWRVDPDACGFPAATTTMTSFDGGAVIVESHLADETVTVAVVDERCDEADWGPLVPGTTMDVDLYVGDVIRVYDGSHALRSAWELAFPFGATLVIQW
jgi:hypothetical protein